MIYTKIYGNVTITYFFIYERIDLLQRLSEHIWRKRLILPGQYCSIFDRCLGTRMETIFTHQLNVSIFVFDLRFFGVCNYYLLFRSWKVAMRLFSIENSNSINDLIVVYNSSLSVTFCWNILFRTKIPYILHLCGLSITSWNPSEVIGYGPRNVGNKE